MESIDKKSLTAVLITAAVAAMLIMTFYLLLLRPQHQTKIKIKNTLSAQKQKYDSFLSIAQPKNKKKLIDQMEKLRAELKTFVIDSDQSANLTFKISNIANEGKVKSFNFNNSKSQKEFEIPDCNQITENYIEIGFLSTFNQFARILNTLERNQPVIFIDEFVITRSEKEDTGHSLNMSLAVFVKKKLKS